MRAALVVMSHPFFENSPQVPSFNGIKKSKHSRRMLPTNRSQNAFAWGAQNGVLRMLKPIASTAKHRFFVIHNEM
jgi:hypothetical protein